MDVALTTKGNVFVGVSTNGGLRFAKVTDIVPTRPKPGAAPGKDQAERNTPSGRPGRQFGNVADQPFIAVVPRSVWVSYASVPSGVIQAAGAKVTGRGRFGSFSPPQKHPHPAGARRCQRYRHRPARPGPGEGTA